MHRTRFLIKFSILLLDVFRILGPCLYTTWNLSVNRRDFQSAPRLCFQRRGGAIRLFALRKWHGKLATIFQGSREYSNQVEESQWTLRLVFGAASITADQFGLDNISRQSLVPRSTRTENRIL